MRHSATYTRNWQRWYDTTIRCLKIGYHIPTPVTASETRPTLLDHRMRMCPKTPKASTAHSFPVRPQLRHLTPDRNLHIKFCLHNGNRNTSLPHRSSTPNRQLQLHKSLRSTICTPLCRRSSNNNHSSNHPARIPL